MESPALCPPHGQVGQSWGTLGHAMSNVDDWREAWNRSADISFGQAVIDFNVGSGNPSGRQHST
jgi:hypothetical protein